MPSPRMVPPVRPQSNSMKQPAFDFLRPLVVMGRKVTCFRIRKILKGPKKKHRGTGAFNFSPTGHQRGAGLGSTVTDASEGHPATQPFSDTNHRCTHNPQPPHPPKAPGSPPPGPEITSSARHSPSIWAKGRKMGGFGLGDLQIGGFLLWVFRQQPTKELGCPQMPR